MQVVCVIQARTGSTRLPGKVMYPLDGRPMLEHVVNRVKASKAVDTPVVATSTHDRDNVLEQVGSRLGIHTHRGSEDDVLERLFVAASDWDADVVVRVTADCPLVPPLVLDALVKQLRNGNYDYVSTADQNFNHVVPNGLGAEAFTFESFREVRRRSTKDHEREHVTTRYRAKESSYDIAALDPSLLDGFDDVLDRSDLRLTVDVAADYELLSRIYEDISVNGLLPVSEAVSYVDERNLGRLNDSVTQVPEADR